MNAIERTLSVCKELNFMVAKVEHFNTFAGVRQDLFGFIDLIAIHPRYGTIGIQVCGKDWSSHIKKLTGQRREALILWLASGSRCILVGWRQLKTDGWQPRVREFTLADFEELTPEKIEALRNFKNKCEKTSYQELTKVLCNI